MKATTTKAGRAIWDIQMGLADLQSKLARLQAEVGISEELALVWRKFDEAQTQLAIANGKADR